MCLLWELGIPSDLFLLETQEFLQLPGCTEPCLSFYVNCASFLPLLPEGRPGEQVFTNPHPSQGHRDLIALAQEGAHWQSPVFLIFPYPLPNSLEEVGSWQMSLQTISSQGVCPGSSTRILGMLLAVPPLETVATRPKECLTFPRLGKICLFTVFLLESRGHFLFCFPPLSPVPSTWQGEE